MAKKTTKKIVKKPAKKVIKKVTKAVSSKKKKVLAIPKGYNTVIPYLIVDGAMNAIEFYKKAFGAKVKFCMPKEEGKVGHAELQIGDSKIMLADEYPEMGAYGPKSSQGAPFSIHLYVKDVDAVVKRAVDAGAQLQREVKDQFYGDRSGGVMDPFGHMWYVSTHIEDVTPAQIKKRLADMKARGEKPC